MTKRRRTSGIQRRERASSEALNRRLETGVGSSLPDWRLLAIGGVLLVGVILIVLVALMGAGGGDDTLQPDDGTAHVPVGTTCRSPEAPCGPDPYSSIPGTSGPHWDPSGVANWGAYSTPQNESQLIHNLEHGGIVIWYDADALTQEQIDEIDAYVEGQVATGQGGRFKFISSPWGGSEPLGGPVAVTAWRHLLTLDAFDMDAIRAFADASYLRYAPEPNGGPAPA
jgi:Protein of unknown function (DUF3105)